MNAEDWINENCKATDWSETANQANDCIHMSNILEYMEKYHKYKVKNLCLFDVSLCCDWEMKMKNLLKGLEVQHIEKFMNEANVNEYLEYGIAYMNEVRHIINKG